MGKDSENFNGFDSFDEFEGFDGFEGFEGFEDFDGSEEEFDLNDEDAFFSILGRLLGQKENEVKIFSFARLKDMMLCKKRLKETAEDSCIKSIRIEFNDMFNSGAVVAEASFMCFPKAAKFTELVCAADNFDIYPLVNGNIELSIGFNAVLIPIA